MRLSVGLCALLSLPITGCGDGTLWGSDDDDYDDDDDLDLENFQEAFGEGHFEGSVAIDVEIASLGSPSISDNCVGHFFLDVRQDDSPEIQGEGECFFQGGLMDYVTTRNEGEITGLNTDNTGSNSSSAQGQIWATIVGDNRDDVSSDWTGGADGDDIYAEFDGDVAFQVGGKIVEIDYVGYFSGELVSN